MKTDASRAPVPVVDRPTRPLLSRVSLAADSDTRDGRRVPAGASGTIVEVLGNGQAYIVEFVRPISAVITIDAPDLRNAVRGED